MNSKSDKNTKAPIFHTPKIMRVTQSWLWPTRILFFLSAGYFLNKSYSGYIDQTIFVHRDYWSLSGDPFMYWFAIIGFLIASLGFIWQALRVKVKT